MFIILILFSFHFYIFAANLNLYTMSKTDWKSKATEYSRDKKRLNKRNKEVTKSRDDWKSKSIRYKALADKLTSDLKKLKQKLNELAEIQ